VADFRGNESTNEATTDIPQEKPDQIDLAP
jgi:hypothetical protein